MSGQGVEPALAIRFPTGRDGDRVDARFSLEDRDGALDSTEERLSWAYAEARMLTWSHMRTLLLVAEVLSPWLVDGDERSVEIWTPLDDFPALERERLVPWCSRFGRISLVIALDCATQAQLRARFPLDVHATRQASRASTGRRQIAMAHSRLTATRSTRTVAVVAAPAAPGCSFVVVW